MSDSVESIDFERVVELVSKYDQIKKSGEIKKYNEESTKKDFILPLFEALGWNVYNRGKRNDSISAEETISKKRVDYGFRINGIPKFFLEAKSLKEENIQTNPNYITQAIDYAWMKSCSWAILCNFDTIAVYNADWKGANFGNNFLFALHPIDFLSDKRFEHLSKTAFANNELDKIASQYGKKQTKNPINKQLLQDMIHFREILSKDVIRNNQEKHLSQEELDESVQRILDRLIFIRNSEDRELEENRLQSNVRQWASRGKGQLVKEISKVYSYFDDQYNSKLFAKHLCDDLYLDNEVLLEVIEGLNHSNDNSYRYDFSVIESDVLGNIYEQYLGNILKSTPKRAKLSESRTHRKEQGIYYTPSYIVDYIVKNTVGEYIKTHTPEEIKNVKILDPACGSGSFLIRAYKELEAYWIKELKLNEGEIKQTRFDIENSEQFYTLKTNILRNNIFGVDLDPKAVEIAQLNLLLQVSERKQKLPLLQSNIKAGNSLVDDQDVSDKSFVWENEFPDIMTNGGFDIVIGNPPYVRQESLGSNFKEYAKKKFEAYSSAADLYTYFIEQSHSLLRENGLFGIICSNKFMRANYGKPLRKLMATNYAINKIVDFGELPVFEEASTFPSIILSTKRKPHKQKFIYAPIKSLNSGNLDDEVKVEGSIMDEKSISGDNWILASPEVIGIMEKMKKVSIPLGEYLKYDIYRGILTGLNSAFIIDEEEKINLLQADHNSIDLLKPFIIGDSIRKYQVRDDRHFLIFIPNGWTKKHSGDSADKWSWFKNKYPAIAAHLEIYSKEANERYDKGEFWWELRPCDYYSKMEKPKILFPDIAKESRFSFDKDGRFIANTAYFIPKSDLFLLGILNSRLVFSYFKRISSVLGDPDKGGRLRWIHQDVVKIPIRKIESSDHFLIKIREQITRLVEDILQLKEEGKKMGDGITDKKLVINDKISNLETKLDQLIYDLYELTDLERQVIENEYS